MEKPFSAYRGDGPYVFACYAHEDSDAVYRELAWLNDYGVNIWYDEGISPGHEWREELAVAIQGCTRVLYFVTPRSVVSEHCRRELNFAQEENVDVVAIHLEPTDLPAGLRLGLNNRQAILRQELTEDEFHKRLMRAAHGGDGPAPRPGPTARGVGWKQWAGIATAVVVMLAVGVGVWWSRSGDIAPAGAEADAIAAAERVPAQEESRKSLAVLPFANLSPDPDNAYFAAGIHDELLTSLAKVNSLKIISRTSVLTYLDSPKNIRDIAAELGVKTIVEGTVRRAGNTVRIGIQLIDADTDENLWAEIYERELNTQNIFAIQSGIATAIANALQATLSSYELAQLNTVPTQSTRAYELYLLGNDYFRWPDDPNTLPLAQTLYEQAISEDPDFALAHAALSQVHGRIHWVGLDRTDRRLELAREAFQRAFELAPGLPEAHVAAGQYYYRGFANYARSLAEYAKAAEGMPGSAQLAMSRAEAYRRLGDVDQSLAYWEQAIALDPRNPLPLFQHSTTSLNARDYAQAEIYIQRGLELDPSTPLYSSLVALMRDGDVSALVRDSRLGWLREIYERDYDASLARLDQWTDDAVSDPFRYLPKASLSALMHRLAGRPEDARAHYEVARIQIENALAANESDPLLQIALGEVLAGLGQSDAAVRAARRAMALRPTSADALVGPNIRLDAVVRVLLPAGEHDAAIEELDSYLAGPGLWSIEGLLRDPRLDPIRNDPRFLALVDKYGTQ